MDFSKEYEVAVVGGGIAGVAAAVQSARLGKKTVLIEKTVFPGGLATTGLIYIYLPLCDGNGHQATFGICEELIQRCMKYGPGDVYGDWSRESGSAENHRYRAVFSPAAFILSLDEFLEENGVDVWLDTLVCGVGMDADRLDSLTVCNKSGLGCIRASQFIDASGDCEIARKCGIPCLPGKNCLAFWALEFRRGMTDTKKFGTGLGDELAVFNRNDGSRSFSGIDGKSVSSFMLKGRKILRNEYRKGESDRHDRFPLTLPAMPQMRRVYALPAEYVLDDSDASASFEDSVGMAGDWRKPGPVWEIPYRSLYSGLGPANLLAAGRNIGAKNDAWEITRVIPTAALTGQAAGLAAALALDSGVTPRALNVGILQRKLRESGVKLFRKECLKKG